MKSKDVVSVLEEKGISPKTQKPLEPAEFDLLFDTLTKAHQITNIEDYLDGVTYIPSKKKAAEAPKAEPPKEMPKEEVKAEPAKEPVQEAPKAEVKAEPKAESKAEPVKEAPAAEAKPAPKAEKTAEPKADAKPAAAPQARPQAPQGAQSRPPMQGQQAQRPAQGQPYGQRPAQGQPYGQRPAQGQPYGQRSAQGQPYGQQRPQGAPQGQRPPYGQGQQGQRPQGTGQPYGAQRPASDRFSTPPYGQGRPQGGAGQGSRPSKPQGGFGGGAPRDKDEGRATQGGRKDTFKVGIIDRSQGNTKPGEKRTGTRVVDMRGGSVDLSKYDERLDTFVPDSVGDVRGGNQRVKKNVAGSNRAAGKPGRPVKGKKTQGPVTKAPTSVTLPSEIMVSELASRLKTTAADIVKRLMMLGMMVTVNQTVDYDTAAIVAEEMGIAATQEVVVTIEERLFDESEDSEESLITRAPVVCVMGHVDHGKTSILDAIRHTRVTAREAGGITQHIGAYSVDVNGQMITFLDTPGHEAFTAMRARGAQATDIAILVVAADDGIMPQTIEAINHAKAAGIDIIVAINKMDKPTANPDNVKQELTKYDLVPEEWGGDVICVPVSALTGQGIEDLLENVLLVAEVKELKANPNRRAKGIIIEAKLDKGRGPVATVLVQNGTLRSGDIVIAGTSVGHIRAMVNDQGRTVKEAGPSVPVEIIGLSEVPSSGDEFNAVEDERMARELADRRRAEAKEEVFRANARANLNDLFAQIAEGVKELNIIVKADVAGSAEAVKQSLEKISNEEVKVRVIHAAAGGIREGDVTLAAASNAIIVGFNVRPDKSAIDSAERQNVEIRTYRVIYDCINEITDAMKGMLAPKFRENLLGHAEVRQTIHVPNVGTIAGSYVQDGKVLRSAMIRVVRDGVVIFEDKISSLRRFKDDVKEVAQGYECGIGLDRFNDIKVGDVLEAYIMEEVER